MSPRRADRVRRAVRWLLPAAALALLPKCALCTLAYVGLAAALGLGGPELCGASGEAGGHAMAWLSVLGATLGGGGFFLRDRAHRTETASGGRGSPTP